MQQFSTFLVTNWPLFLALVIILFLLVRSYVGPGAAKALTPMQALQLINHQDALVLDVRTEKEFNEGHIINAMSAPLGVLSNRLTQLAPYKQSPIIVVCRSGARSGQAVATLKKAGFGQIYNLSGGIMAWQSANMPLTTEKGKPPKPASADPKGGKKTQPADDGEQEPEPKAIGHDDDADFSVADDTAEEGPGEEAKEETALKPPEVVIYTGAYCPYCMRALQLLKSKGVAYTELNVDRDSQLRQEMVARSGSDTVPQIFVDGRHIGNCDDIHEIDAQGRLDELLGLERA